MNEIAKSVGMYALTGSMAWLASRYHLNGEQTAALMADVMTGLSVVSGVAMHYLAFKATPPK